MESPPSPHKLYRIRNWPELYENSRSRKVENTSWVPIPNRHDGENYSAIMAHPSGAIIFAAWILLLQVASKCQPRGTLVRDNRTPHTPLSLSLKTRAPIEWFTTALDYLEEHTDWLEYEHVAHKCHTSDTRVIPECHPSAEEQNRTEGNGTELNGREGNPPPDFSDQPDKNRFGLTAPAMWKEVLFWLNQTIKDGSDYTEPEARSAFLAMSANGWMWGKNAVTDWRSAIERQIQSDRSRPSKQQPKKPESNQRHEEIQLPKL